MTPDASKQLVTVPEREQLSELEAQRIGEAAIRLARLRPMLDAAASQSGSIWVSSGPRALNSYLPSSDLQAAIAFLIERDELLLASFNVKIERPE